MTVQVQPCNTIEGPGASLSYKRMCIRKVSLGSRPVCLCGKTVSRLLHYLFFKLYGTLYETQLMSLLVAFIATIAP